MPYIKLTLKSVTIKALLLTLLTLFLLAKTNAATLSQNMTVAQKKQAFFNQLSPLANKANQAVSKDRAHLLNLKKTKKLSTTDTQWLLALSNRYQVIPTSPTLIKDLLEKVDTIPNALILAQAANESAWGTSRFAKQGNNLFGQWCFKQGCGLVPKARTKGKSHEVRKFNTKFDSVNAYLFNINTNSSYNELRKIRAKLRRQKKEISGIALSQGLLRYSERGSSYVKDIINMIKSNKLE